MKRKILLTLAIIILIAEVIVWGGRLIRGRKLSFFYNLLKGKNNVTPIPEEVVEPEVSEVPASVVGVAVYQNGVTGIVRCVNPGAVKSFRVAGNFVPLNGSLAFDPCIRDVRKIRETEESPVYYAPDHLAKCYSGQLVTVKLSDGGGEITGTVIDTDQDEQATASVQFLTLQLANGSFSSVQCSRILSLSAVRFYPMISKVKKTIRESWLFSADEPLTKAARFSYLTSGMEWRAFLALTLSNENMGAELNGELINHLCDLEDVPVTLASGAPDFEESTDAMALIAQNWSRKMAPQYGRSVLRSQAMAANDAVAMGVAASPATQNIRYFPVGKVTMKKDEVLTRKLGQAQGKCERLVVWRTSSRDEGAAKEILRFVNPFKFPIPVGTIIVSELGSAPFAQVKSKWLNVGEKRTIELMNAPSITVKREEKLIALETETPVNAKRRYRLRTMEGVLTVKNRQSKAVKMMVENQFFGKLLSADGDPETSGMPSRRNLDPGCKLTWEFPLAPGEEKKITFRYQDHVQ